MLMNGVGSSSSKEERSTMTDCRPANSAAMAVRNHGSVPSSSAAAQRRLRGSKNHKPAGDHGGKINSNG
ncbi:hypothetical protein ACLOJK_023246 [Asimina triloba]